MSDAGASKLGDISVDRAFKDVDFGKLLGSEAEAMI
jgi:hypothetical protein